MNGTGERKIEVFAPFGAAIDLTKLILFQPFDVAKWLTIGFAAFLSHLAGAGPGGGFGPHLPGGDDWNWNFRSTTNDALEATGAAFPAWVYPLIAIVVVVILAVVLVCFWLGSRGKFIFTDCIVRNRAEIVRPWQEFRREGNSLFLYSLVVMFATLVAIAVLGAPVWLPLLAGRDLPSGPAFVVTLLALTSVFAVVGTGLLVINAFMVPIMYRRRCGAFEAFKAALGMVAAEPGPVILYVLFIVVLWIAFAIVGCLITVITCCVAAIPYIGTVIMLPFYVFFASYLLLFVRQFGPEFDAWANVVATPLPMQESPAIAPPLELPPSDPPAPSEPPPPPPVQT
ncbi:MAG TPA: hypothetical protein VF683_04220 [Chthoniobacterales bacterium]|jgi:hypothetical protein